MVCYGMAAFWRKTVVDLSGEARPLRCSKRRRHSNIKSWRSTGVSAKGMPINGCLAFLALLN
jgi:hypothetical protein